MARTVVLLTASWCPRCPAAKRLWAGLRDRLGFDLRELDVDAPEGQKAAEHWRIASVPAVIVDGHMVSEAFDEARAMDVMGMAASSVQASRKIGIGKE
jgi:glutaredoxin